MKKVNAILLVILLMILVGCTNNETKQGKLVIRYYISGDVDIEKEYETLDNFEVFVPSKEGYSFQGWYLDEDYSEKLNIDDLELPSSSQDNLVILYAKWTVQRFVVKFYCNGQVVSTQSVEYGKAAKEPTPTIKNGYIFKSWDCEFSSITSDLTINAIYDINTNTNNILVVLGNRMNNDGSITNDMRKRLELTILADAQFSPSYIIVSGGLANPTAGITEAQAMYDYLVSHGVDKNKIIKEDKSLSTAQNATYSIKLLEDVEFSNLIIISNMYHFTDYKTIDYFNDAVTGNSKLKNKGIHIMIYTDAE